MTACVFCQSPLSETYNAKGKVSSTCTGCGRAQVEQRQDPVNHPSHYTQGDVECIDAIEAALTPEEFRGYCKGAAIKYVWRERHKGGDESLRKAIWYLERIT